MILPLNHLFRCFPTKRPQRSSTPCKSPSIFTPAKKASDKLWKRMEIFGLEIVGPPNFFHVKTHPPYPFFIFPVFFLSPFFPPTGTGVVISSLTVHLPTFTFTAVDEPVHQLPPEQFGFFLSNQFLSTCTVRPLLSPLSPSLTTTSLWCSQ